MIINDKIRDEKLQYDINREEIVPFNQRQIIEQAKLAYSPQGKAFEKNPRKIGWSYKISWPL